MVFLTPLAEKRPKTYFKKIREKNRLGFSKFMERPVEFIFGGPSRRGGEAEGVGSGFGRAPTQAATQHGAASELRSYSYSGKTQRPN
jgi:hypothetical protein